MRKATTLALKLFFAVIRLTALSSVGFPDFFLLLDLMDSSILIFSTLDALAVPVDLGLLVDLTDALTETFSRFPQFNAILDVLFGLLGDGSDCVVHTQTDISNTFASEDLGRIDMLIDATNNYIAELNGVPKTDACTSSSATQVVDCETEIPNSDASGNSPGMVSLSADVINILEVADGKKTEDCTSTTTNENSPVNLKRQLSQILKTYGKDELSLEDKKRGAQKLLEILTRQKKRKQKRSPIIVVGPQFVKPNVMDLSITLKREVVKKKIIVNDVNNNFMMKVRTRIGNMNHRILSDNEGNPLVLIKSEDIGAHQGWHVFMGEKDVPEKLLYQLKKSNNSGFQVFLAENKKQQVCNFMIKKTNNAGAYSMYVGDSSGDDTIAEVQKKGMNVTYGVTIYSNVDYAFIVSLAAILCLEDN